MGYVLIIGATSDIGKAIAKKYAENGYNLYLATRNTGDLDAFAQSLNIQTQQSIKILKLDILNYASHKKFYNSIEEKPVGIISAIGYLGDQIKAQSDFIEAQKIIDTNYTGIVSLFNIFADKLEKQKSGFIIGISSVAGDRGRKRNFLYGSAKAALTVYLSGLRNRLYQNNVHVLTVKPGYVSTKMTEGMDLPKKLTAQPDEVANDIYRAQQQGKNILYTKWIWKWIMLIVRKIPEFQFKKMDI